EAFIIRTPIELTAEPVRRPATVGGYRLQIFSASNQEAAVQAQHRAQEVLERKDVYVVFEPPYFKVRIGNFRTREAAEAFAETAQQHGYDTPFPVQTQVLVSPE
ncbi:MAG: SPOR domain-containing protein, partial [bacterium]|nr:SPOR domain-containing protein [bacterium]